ncbi:MAG: hypothetical protein KF830_06430 [Planctomycetes bacterium]|nr:hypothetical protein [Planctomycetota bacterium]
MLGLTDRGAQELGAVLMLVFIAWALDRGSRERAEAVSNPEGVRRRRRTRLAVLLLVAAVLVVAVVFYDPRGK